APQALHGVEIVDGVSDFPHLLYFSYVTLTTLGYGDVTPAIPLTRTLAYLEAITGTFYLAIVVASLLICI
ncbi:MAG: two pore domain potassium channel family protein, partial [Gammaproteobacteria bacterium]|nr:two pore domain potassium channel family protein [Gammaproteobacteria bacterium]